MYVKRDRFIPDILFTHYWHWFRTIASFPFSFFACRLSRWYGNRHRKNFPHTTTKTQQRTTTTRTTRTTEHLSPKKDSISAPSLLQQHIILSMGRLFPFSSSSSSSRTSSPPPSSRVVKRGRPPQSDGSAADYSYSNDTAATTTMTSTTHIPSSPIRPRSASYDGGTAINATNAAMDTTPRRRCNSREYPRSYSGQYGQGDDLLPLEIQRHQRPPHFPTFCGLYLTLILVVHWMVVLAIFTTDTINPTTTWTVTHAIHATATLWWLHWCKGSWEDAAGEMNALTTWEQ